ncbi:MAG TPA: ABC transporter permease [Bryobacteraceae bacterium]|nr:ABC transporter permease [Bryobacteraceae bacterium]
MRIPGRHFLRNLFAGRTLLFQLVRRDFRQRFVGSAAGWLWGLIQPIVLLASYSFVFQVCLRMEPPPDAGTSNYTIYLFCGFLPWLLFQETVTRSASSLLENASLITKTVFPSEIVPLAIFLSSLISHLLALALVLAAVAIWGGGLSPMAVLLPVYMALLGLLAVGIGWIVSSLQVYLRDTAQMLVVVMTFWFWMTPIFIDAAMIPPQLRFVVRWNPLAGIVQGYRERLLRPDLPGAGDLLLLAAVSASVFIAGGLFFRQLKRGFADVL